MAPAKALATIATEWDDCGNSFNSLHDLIMWLIKHGKHPPPPPDDWLIDLTNVAQGLEKVVYAISIKDSALRASLAKQGLDQAKASLNAINVEARG